MGVGHAWIQLLQVLQEDSFRLLLWWCCASGPALLRSGIVNGRSHGLETDQAC